MSIPFSFAVGITPAAYHDPQTWPKALYTAFETTWGDLTHSDELYAGLKPGLGRVFPAHLLSCQPLRM